MGAARARESLLIAEDDTPMRLVAVGLGAPMDRGLSTALDWLLGEETENAVTELQQAAGDLGLAGSVEARVACGESLDGQLAGVAYLLVERAVVTAATLVGAPDLRLIQQHGRDCRNIDLVAARERGIPVAILRRRANAAVAEHTVMLMLAVLRRLHAAQAAARSPVAAARRHPSHYNWARMTGGAVVRGLTLGLIGLGEIGREVAQRAAAFETRVLYTQRRRLEPALERTLGAEFRPFNALLAESDIVSLHLPLTPETRHLIGAPEIARMRRGAVLVNTARGGLVDEAALLTALRAGHLRGAGLDVRAEEPPGDTRLADLPTVVATPHVAAGSGREIVEDARAVLENIARTRRGEDPVERALPT